MSDQTLSLAARYVFPVEGDPLENGIVDLRKGKLVAIGNAKGRAPDLDLGNVALVPGFVNAHTHLELGSLPPATSSPATIGQNQVQWLRQVIRQRLDYSQDQVAHTILANLQESLRAGTTLLADITTNGQSWPALSSAPIRCVVFSELIGLRRQRAQETSRLAWEWVSQVQRTKPDHRKSRVGLSPHAPYSTAGWLYERAAASGLPLTTHLAEMPEELQLLSTRDGPLRQFLEEIDAWDDNWEPVGPRPAQYVRRGELRRADWLIAHGTYFDPSEFWQLRQEAAPDGHRVALAYCPRTHASFGHAPHPFRTMLARQIAVCLGTDSRASTPSLSILDEARFLFRQDPSLPGSVLLAMSTLFGAFALRFEAITGSLLPGKSADMAVIALPDRIEADPHRLLYDSNLPVLATVFEGKFITGHRAQP